VVFHFCPNKVFYHHYLIPPDGLVRRRVDEAREGPNNTIIPTCKLTEKKPGVVIIIL